MIFSGRAHAEDAPFLDEIRAIRAGFGFGSIIGRNAFQRSKPDALTLLGTVAEIYSPHGDVSLSPPAAPAAS